jgi:hypothetical protein
LRSPSFKSRRLWLYSIRFEPLYLCCNTNTRDRWAMTARCDDRVGSVFLNLTAASLTHWVDRAEPPQILLYRSRLGHKVTGIALIALAVRALFPDPWSEDDLAMAFFLGSIVVVGWLVHWEFAAARRPVRGRTRRTPASGRQSARLLLSAQSAALMRIGRRATRRWG